MGGGGGSSGGGMVVGGPAPWAAGYAGQLQSQAAAQAAQIAQQTVQDAIRSINQNFNTARNDLAPYRTTGVQALDKLNQYLGLAPYNPGEAPKAPDAPTRENLLKNQTRSDVINQLYSNLGIGSYNGVMRSKWTGPLPEGENTAWSSAFKGPIGMNAAQYLANNKAYYNIAANQLADEQMGPAQKDYDVALQQYNKDVLEHQQNLDWYNQYSAEGPKTASQITEEVTNQPGYQSLLGQGIEAINRGSSSRGLLQSGAQLRDLAQYGGGLQASFYGQMLDRLANQAGLGANAAGATAGIAQNKGSSIAGLQSNLGDTLANAALSAGNARSQAVLAGNQQYQVIGGGGGGGGMGGIGSVLGGIGSILGSGIFG